MVPDRIGAHIRGAWIVTAVMGLGTGASYFAARAGMPLPVRAAPSLLVRSAILLVFAWGISRRSRAAILAVLALFLWSRLDLLLRSHYPGVRLAAAVSLLLVGYFLVQGARAIFAFHRGMN